VFIVLVFKYISPTVAADIPVANTAAVVEVPVTAVPVYHSLEAPVAPLAPVGPTGPVGPVLPVPPVAPVGPVLPCLP
jgi:hypothetical protein